MYDIGSIISKYPKFTKEEEAELIAGYDSDPDGVREKLFYHNFSLVPYVVNRMYWVKDEHQKDEYMSFGVEGLKRASEMFNPKTGYKFSTYAVTTIRRHIIRMTKPSRIDEQCYHIDTPLKSTNDSDGDGERTVEQVIYKDINPDFILLKSTTHYVERDSRRELVHEIIEKLRRKCRTASEHRSFNVVCDYYLGSRPDGSKYTLEELGKKYGVSRERIRQMLNEEMRVMRMRLFNGIFGVDERCWWLERNSGIFDYKKLLHEIRD
jgi:RNA polymerase sigma factor (sigma-70 family)